MAVRLNYHLFMNASTATSSDWYPCDYRDGTGGQQRGITGNIVSGDTVIVEVTAMPDIDNIHADSIRTVGSFTADFADVIEGPWAFIRVTKTGTTGVARIEGVV